MGIEIKIKAGTDLASSSIKVTGNNQHIVTDKERGSFGIHDSALKNGISKYFGKKPNDAYLCSPTPWNDLYKRYSWNQVETMLDVQKATITEITSEPVIVAKKTFTNSSSKKATFNCGISDQVTNTTSSNWSKTNNVSFGQKVNYSIEFLGTGAGGETSMSYSHTWGEGGSQSKGVAVGTASGVNIELDPGESVEAQLTASRGVMKVRMDYKVYLSGSVAVNYSPAFKSHHFWGLPINNIMKSGGLKPIQMYTEDIEIGYYSNSNIEIKDRKGVLMATFFATDKPGVTTTV